MPTTRLLTIQPTAPSRSRVHCGMCGPRATDSLSAHTPALASCSASLTLSAGPRCELGASQCCLEADPRPGYAPWVRSVSGAGGSGVHVRAHVEILKPRGWAETHPRDPRMNPS